MSFRIPVVWGPALLALLLPVALTAQTADPRSNPTGFHFGAMLKGPPSPSKTMMWWSQGRVGPSRWGGVSPAP